MPILGPLDPFRTLSSLKSGTARIARAMRADHATLNERSMRTHSGVMTYAFLHAAAALSRRIRPGSTDDLVERAAVLASDLGLPTVPAVDACSQLARFVDIVRSDTYLRASDAVDRWLRVQWSELGVPQ
jgi:hypothetical protein